MSRPIGLFLTVVAAVLVVPCARAQGYLSANGRNHPELVWLQAETVHFRIIYPRRISGIEVQAGAIAEETYAVLSENLGVSFSEKIRIYLSDEDEIVNGFAVPVGAGHTNIWVHLNDASEVWTGREKWLRKVVSHELAHIFHYRAVRSPFRPFDLRLALPRFWTEGLAQYETEKWDAYRGERWLRTAVLDDRLSYNDGRSIWNGRLLYSVGNAQVRFFASEYGDSSIVSLLSHRRRILPGIRIHDFYHAFEAVTGSSYREFYDRWRRHINIQYNTIAGQMENADSLGVPESIPGQYVRDAVSSRDGSLRAAVILVSIERPVDRLVVKERQSGSWRVLVDGGVRGPVSISPLGDRIAYTRLVRGEHGSLLNDLYEVDVASGQTTRLTRSRRASYPSYSPDGGQIAFVGSTSGTGNIYVLDLPSGNEWKVTDLRGDEQLSHVAWHPSQPVVAYSRFDGSGSRHIETIEIGSDQHRVITDGRYDDRGPIWSPDGQSIAFTSLRDGVPNVFVKPVSGAFPQRVTALATGAEVLGWRTDSTAAGRLTVRVATSKSRDRIYSIAATRRTDEPEIELPPGYSAWTRHRPPQEIPSQIPERTDVVQSRTPYRSLSNLTHVASLAIPYYAGPDNYGIAGFTSWTEPLGKHTLGILFGAAVSDFVGKSSIQIAYVNNQFRPLLQTTIQHLPEVGRPYGAELLLERTEKVSLTARWPVSLTSAPFVSSSIALRARYVDVEPLNPEDFVDVLLPTPEAGHQTDLRLSFEITRQRPYRYNVVHPLDGLGLRARVMGALRSVSGRTGFIRGDLGVFGILRGPGRTRLFAYGRALAQQGETLAQNFIGLSRYDGFQVRAPDIVQISFSDVERVRGYRQFAAGRSVWFGSIEYRIPLARSLRTELLGLVSLGATSVTLFADAAAVYPDFRFRNADRRLGVGVEVKNAVTLYGLLTVMHAVGIAQKADEIGSSDYDLYYRVRAAVPF